MDVQPSHPRRLGIRHRETRPDDHRVSQQCQCVSEGSQNGSKQVDLPFTPPPPAALLRLTHLINVLVAEAPFPYNIAKDPTNWRNEGARIARDTLSIDRLDRAGEFEFENPNQEYFVGLPRVTLDKVLNEEEG